MFYEVIISAVNSGRVRRKSFDTWEEADRCADQWRNKYFRGHLIPYRVEIVRRELPPVHRVIRPAAVGEAA